MTPRTLYRFMLAAFGDRPQLFRMLRPYYGNNDGSIRDRYRDTSGDVLLTGLMSIAAMVSGRQRRGMFGWVMATR